MCDHDQAERVVMLVVELSFGQPSLGLRPGPLDLTWRHPAASYVTLAAAPAGNGWELLAVVALIYAVYIFVAAWRYARRPGPGGNADGH